MLGSEGAVPPESQVRMTGMKVNKSPARSWVLSQAHWWAVSQSPRSPPVRYYCCYPHFTGSKLRLSLSSLLKVNNCQGMNLGPRSMPPGPGHALLDSGLEDTNSSVSLVDPGPPSFTLGARPSPPLTLPGGAPVLQGVAHASPAPLLGPLLCLLPLRQPQPPQAQRVPAAPVPGPAGSQLPLGSLGH